MDFTSIKFRPYKYKIESFILTIPGLGDYNVDPKYITKVVIEKNYDRYIYPYFEVTMNVPNNVYRAAQKENIDIRAYIHMVGGFSDIAMILDDYSPDEVYNEEDYINWTDEIINSKMYCFSDMSTVDVTEENDKKAEEETDASSEMSVSNNATLTVSLYNEDYLFKLKETVNTVLNGVTTTEAMAYILNKVGINKILCSPATNEQTYSELLLPPNSAAENMDYLANNYAMHECGTLVFFDFQRGYILNKDAICTAYETNEPKKTYITSVSREDESIFAKSGSSFIDNCGVVNLTAGSYQFSTPSVVNDQKYGSNIVSVDSRTGDVSQIESTASTSENGGSTQVYTVESGEDSSVATASALKEASMQGNISMANTNFTFFNPNREIEIVMDNSNLNKYNGLYRVSSMSTTMVANAGVFSSSTSIVLLGYGNNS